MQFIAENNVPRLSAVFASAVKHGQSARAVLSRLHSIVEFGKQTSKQWTENEKTISAFLLAVGGPTVVYCLNKMGVLPGVTIARHNFGAVVQLDPQGITLETLRHLVEHWQFPKKTGPNQPVVYNIALDYMYIEERAVWDPSTNHIAGLCYEHLDTTMETQLGSIDDAMLLRQCLDNEEIHLLRFCWCICGRIGGIVRVSPWS